MSIQEPPVRKQPRAWREDDWDDPELLPVYDLERPARNRSWLRWVLGAVALVVVGALIAGGKDPGGLDEALAIARAAASGG